MKFLRTVCLISLGGWLDSLHGGHNALAWLAALGVSGAGWGWLVLGASTQRLVQHLGAVVTGRPLPRTDPKALAAEVAALNAQIASLRDTATSFDVSFDETLRRLDERLRRLEQQSAYVQAGRSQ